MNQEALDILIKMRSEGMEQLDRMIAGMGSAGHGADEFRQRAHQLNGQLQQLEKQQQLINRFERVKERTDETAQAYAQAQQKAQQLGQELSQLESPTKKQQAAFERAQKAVITTDAAWQKSALSLGKVRHAMAMTGMDASKLASEQERIRRETGQAQASVDKMASELRQMGRTSSQASGELGKMGHAASQAGGELGKMGHAASQAGGELGKMGKTRAGLESISTQLGSMRNQLLGLAGINIGSGMIKDALATADAYKHLEARIKLAAGEGNIFQQAMTGVGEVALRTHSSLESTGQLFTRIAKTGRDAGLGAQEAMQQALGLTETINQAIQLSGASAQASDAAITQLIQGLQSGVLRGEEFNSVMEQSPRLAQMMTDGLRVNTGELRKMAEEGRLTAATVMGAIQSQAATVKSEFDKLPPTIGRAVQDLNTRWTLFVGNLERTHGVAGTVAQGISGIADHLEQIAEIATHAGMALAAAFAWRSVSALRAYAAEAGMATVATTLLSKSIKEIPANVNIAVALTGFELGWQLGKWLHENSELARKLGVSLSEYFAHLVNNLQVLMEAGKALFTDDTVADAFGRWKKRSQDVVEIHEDLFNAAEQAPEKVSQAAQKAAAAQEQMGKAGQEAGGAIAQGGNEAAGGVEKAGKAAETAEGALKALAASAKVELPASAKAGYELANALHDAANKSWDVASAMGDGIAKAIEKLHGKELQNFVHDFGNAMGQTKDNAWLVQVALREVGLQAAKSLGVDVAMATGRVSSEFVKADADLTTLLNSFDVLKAEGVDAVGLVEAALKKMIDGAKNQQDIDALTKKITELRDKLGDKVADGFLDQAKQKMQELKDAADSATGGINSLREATKELGLKSRDELQRTAKKAEEAYGVIKKAGQQEGESNVAWQRRKADAAKVMLQRMIEANGGVADSYIKSKAAAEGFVIEVDNAGRTTVALSETTKRATGEMADGYRNVAGEVRGVANEQERLNQLRRQGGGGSGSGGSGSGGDSGSGTGTGAEGRRVDMRDPQYWKDREKRMEESGKERASNPGMVDMSWYFNTSEKLKNGTLSREDMSEMETFVRTGKQHVQAHDAAGTFLSFDGRRSRDQMSYRVREVESMLAKFKADDQLQAAAEQAAKNPQTQSQVRDAAPQASSSMQPNAQVAQSRTYNINLSGFGTVNTDASGAAAIDALLKQLEQAKRATGRAL